MTMFDNYLMVDWSSNKKPKTGADSIWLAWVKKNEQIKFFNPKNRSEALEKITELLKNNGRTIVGFDFPFGYPADSYSNFGFDNWSKLWKFIHDEIMDEGNERNRFEVAGKINNTYFGNLFENNDEHHGPFWGHPNPNNNRFKGLPFNKQEGYNRNLKADKKLPEQFRTIEKLTEGAKSVWQLYGNGSVGSQVLLGIPVVNILREESNCLVWPFVSFKEIDNSDKHVIAEIYPSIWNEDEKNIGLCKDAGQVKTVVQQIFCQDKKGDLKNLLNEPYNHDKKDIITEKEGWILGVNKTGEVAKIIKENRPYILYD
ncbi:MAG: hypothetical protein K8953_05500 [Proteobacteria bacterium]|nr:hypothetical protein [Pseudomonadota bacterium]